MHQTGYYCDNGSEIYLNAPNQSWKRNTGKSLNNEQQRNNEWTAAKQRTTNTAKQRTTNNEQQPNNEQRTATKQRTTTKQLETQQSWGMSSEIYEEMVFLGTAVRNAE